MGAQTSLMETEIETEVRQITENNLDAKIGADSETICSNLQQIKDSTLQGCQIKFGPQSCNAQSLMRFVGQNTLESETKQEIIDIAKQITKQDMSGIAVGQFQTSIQRMKQKASYDQLSKTNMALNTDCSQSLDLANIQNFENTDCEDSKVNYALQTISAKTMADCAATQGAKQFSSQGLTKMLEQSSKQKLDGISLSSILLPLLLFPLIMILLPGFIGRMISNTKNALLGEVPTEKPKPSIFTKMAKWVLILIILSLIAWWPGIGSWYLGIWPYGNPNDNKNSPCQGKELKTTAYSVNKYFQYDPACAQRPKDDLVCTKDKKIFHYKCGITSGLCDTTDPTLSSGLEKYKNYLRACGKLRADAQYAPFSSCDPSAIFNKAVSKKFEGCKVCTSGKYQGGMVNENADCAEVPAMYTKYYIDKDDKIASPCKSSEENCFESKNDYIEKTGHKDDCMVPGYQNSKRRVAKFLEACAEINKHAPEGLKRKEGGEELSLTQQCSGGATQFINCSGDDCFYAAAGCTWTGSGPQPDKLTKEDMAKFNCQNADANAIKACKNDFTGCEKVDNNYKEDTAFDRAGAENCKNAYEEWENRHYTGMYATIGVYTGLFIFAVLLAFVGHKKEMAQLRQNESIGGKTVVVSKPKKTSKVTDVVITN